MTSPSRPSDKLPAGASIAAFCRERRLPQRRILRLVKDMVLDHAGEGAEGASGCWQVDLTSHIGVAARGGGRSGHNTYRVTDADQLLAFAAHELGADLLTAEELEHIADAARSYYEVAMGENEKFVIVSRATGQRFSPNESGYFEPLYEALQRMGK